jgi:hypothetical protein
MKKIVILVFILSSVQITAQNKKTTLSAGGGVYVGYSDGTSIGPGFEIKAGRNLSENSQITLSAGLINLRTTKNDLNNDYTHTRLVPFMLGYKRKIKNFFIEPKAGIGELGGKFNISSDYAKPSVFAVFYSLNAGYSIKRVDIVAELSSGAFGAASKDAGFWNNRKVMYSGLKVGFNLF